MIKGKGILQVLNSVPQTQEIEEDIQKLPDGEYGYLIFDKEKNKSLPQLKYLFGIVLKTISDSLPEHPSVNALYKYYEELFSPLHTCYIHGEKFKFIDLKSETTIEMNDITEKIIHHAKETWNIDVILRSDLKKPEASAPYLEAYAEQWKDFSRKI